MKTLYQFAGTFEFYEISNYLWILLGVFLLIYATNREDFNLFKIVIFVYGILYGTLVGGMLKLGMPYILVGIVLTWILVEILLNYKKDWFGLVGVYLVVNRFLLRILLYFDHSSTSKETIIILSMIASILLVCAIYMLQKKFGKKERKEDYRDRVFVLLSTDFAASGLCEVFWKQSEGTWKFFHDKNAVYEYYIYMSKIEIREIHILIFYVIIFCLIYLAGMMALKIRRGK